MKKIPVGILGASGLVGQNYLKLLKNHPFFEVTFQPSSKTSLNEALKEAKGKCRLIFSALPDAVAKECEFLYAKEGFAVFSTASCHRLEPDIPLIIPEINPSHLDLIPLQQKKRGFTKGFVVAKPNCTLQSYLLPLYPLHRAFTVKKLMVTTLQAISGAGKTFNLEKNAIPYIFGEEEKSENEPLKILGSVTGKGIHLEEGIAISTHCNRVPILSGHLACVSVSFERKPQEKEVLTLWKEFKEKEVEGLPSAPSLPLIYLEGADRPQPLLDCNRENGMVVTIGRLRKCPVLDFRFAALSHNLIRGAAGGSILSAELAYKKGFLW